MGQLTSSYQIKPIFTNRNLAQGCLNYCNITLKTNKMAKLRHLGKYRHFYFSFKLRALLLHYVKQYSKATMVYGLKETYWVGILSSRMHPVTLFVIM